MTWAKSAAFRGGMSTYRAYGNALIEQNRRPRPRRHRQQKGTQAPPVPIAIEHYRKRKEGRASD